MDILQKLNPWHKDPPQPPPSTPPLPKTQAYLLITLYALIYFIPFYLSPLTRPSPTLSRDAPSVIRARIRSVLISTSICLLTTYFLLLPPTPSSPSPFHLLGFYPFSFSSTFSPVFLTSLLFLGPLYSYFIIDQGYKPWFLSLHQNPIKDCFTNYQSFRNYIIGPITEELLFRSSAIPLLLPLPPSITPSKLLYIIPLIFGLSHIHHYYEFTLQNPRVPRTAVFIRSLFQLGFTTLFGAYATFLYLRTGNLYAVCLVHTFCNSMGLPQVWGRVEFPDEYLGEKRRSILWTVGYYILLVTGAVLWYKNLWVLTESEYGLVRDDAWRR
ncbi:putative protease [Podospora fimiseda]|uniref:intramembrane prenyl-peptidase Rce1 n=1 Tax=Podospora fimiseda TaxID=252190 RepID=A0AAN7BQR5_9PEZI|nr:putative protease [Podospora fimiseda]